MTISNLQNLFMSWNWVVMPEDWSGFERYTSQMLKRERVILLRQGQEKSDIMGILFFFITDNYESFFRKPVWDAPEDLKEGKIVFVDKFACRHWSVSIRRLMRPILEGMFPWADEVIYYRPLKERCIKIKREGVLK